MKWYFFKQKCPGGFEPRRERCQENMSRKNRGFKKKEGLLQKRGEQKDSHSFLSILVVWT